MRISGTSLRLVTGGGVMLIPIVLPGFASAMMPFGFLFCSRLRDSLKSPSNVGEKMCVMSCVAV
jgi:hypothetical protein